TKLPNRDTFVDRLKVALRNAADGRERLAVLFLDLDRFKRLNDTFGHAVGDRLLQTVAARLAGCVPSNAMMARYGGDEVRVVLSGDAAAHPEPVAEALLAATKRPCLEAGHEIVITASVGAAVFPQDGEDWSQLLRKASAAADAAKRDGRDAYRSHSTALNNEALTLLALETRLRKAVEAGEFVLHYQPVVELSTARLVGCEALLRWAHPKLGLVAPADFIDLAERTGLIVGIGGWVLQEACRQARAWHRVGHAGLSGAVNVSAQQLQRPNFGESVRDTIEAAGIPASAPTLHITETAAMVDGAA